MLEADSGFYTAVNRLSLLQALYNMVDMNGETRFAGRDHLRRSIIRQILVMCELPLASPRGMCGNRPVYGEEDGSRRGSRYPCDFIGSPGHCFSVILAASSGEES